VSRFLNKEYELIWDYLKHIEFIREKYIRLYLLIVSGVLALNWYLFGVDEGKIVKQLFGEYRYSSIVALIVIVSWGFLVLYGLLLLRTLFFQKQVYSVYHDVLVDLRRKLFGESGVANSGQAGTGSLNKIRYKSWRGFLLYLYWLLKDVGFSQMFLVVLTNLSFFLLIPVFLVLYFPEFSLKLDIPFVIIEVISFIVWYILLYFAAVRDMDDKYTNFREKSFKVYYSYSEKERRNEKDCFDKV